MAHDDEQPSRTLSEWLDDLPTGPALDLACGTGRQGLLLARRGDSVEGWDRDGGALAKFATHGERLGITDQITVRTVDLESDTFDPPRTGFSTILVFRYLWRPLFDQIPQWLATGGHLLYETFVADPHATKGPTNPQFLLQPNELLRAFPGLHVLRYRERPWSDGSVRASLLARRPSASP
jgi:SAM-dependent methyltransferase